MNHSICSLLFAHFFMFYTVHTSPFISLEFLKQFQLNEKQSKCANNKRTPPDAKKRNTVLNFDYSCNCTCAISELQKMCNEFKEAKTEKATATKKRPNNPEQWYECELKKAVTHSLWARVCAKFFVFHFRLIFIAVDSQCDDDSCFFHGSWKICDVSASVVMMRFVGLFMFFSVWSGNCVSKYLEKFHLLFVCFALGAYCLHKWMN